MVTLQVTFPDTDKAQADRMKQIVHQALMELLSLRRPHGDYIAKRYAGMGPEFKQRKLAELEQREVLMEGFRVDPLEEW